MSDKRKILTIILIVLAFYWIYYSKDAIVSFVKDPIGTIKRDATPITKVLDEV